MVENLDISGIDPVMSDETFAALAYEAGWRLAGAALTITGLDMDAAAPILREALQAIGAKPYDRKRKYHFGQPPPDEAA